MSRSEFFSSFLFFIEKKRRKWRANVPNIYRLIVVSTRSWVIAARFAARSRSHLSRINFVDRSIGRCKNNDGHFQSVSITSMNKTCCNCTTRQTTAGQRELCRDCQFTCRGEKYPSEPAARTKVELDARYTRFFVSTLSKFITEG